tara:strand:- start:35 stop:310 length:276 start_codon:yes stop_codon:yes gene_type:complete
MEFKISYSKRYHSLVIKLEKEYKIVKEIINKSNIFDIYFGNEIIYSNKDNFNDIEINEEFISSKISNFIQSRYSNSTKRDRNLDNIDLDDF